MILCLPVFYSASTISTVNKDVEKELWHIKAVTPDGKFLNVKAIDKNGKIFAVKALEVDGNTHMMDIRLSSETMMMRCFP